jgi:flavin reductase (DIM6/NTAB) family NADH-FMN oxidoreductase RutF
MHVAPLLPPSGAVGQVTGDTNDHNALRAALGHYATGVAVVTTQAADGQPVGMTINSFSSLSLDPPLILWCLRRNSTRRHAFTVADYFAVNVLAAGQEQLARRFATSADDRFADLAWPPGPSNLPLIPGRLGTFICRRADIFNGGDHLIITGQLEEYSVVTARLPLLFYRGCYLSPI